MHSIIKNLEVKIYVV